MRVLNVCILGIMSVAACRGIALFQTLPEIEAHAKLWPENVVSEGRDWTNPVFYTFHESQEPSFFDSFWFLLGIKKKTWDSADLMTLIQEVSKSQQANKPQGSFAAHLRCTQNDILVVIGDLYGAFHSLVHTLRSLAQQGIINEKLQLQKNNYFIIFNGNQISRSPYNLETLQVILMLMARNPGRVIYVKGVQETNDYWLNFVLRHEIKKRIAPDSVTQKISDFFDSLPVALYVTSSQDRDSMICFAPQGSNTPDLDQQFLGDLFLSSPEPLTYYELARKTPTSGKIPSLCAWIKSESWIEGTQAPDGLGLINQDNGVTAWAVFSSPLPVHQAALNFFYDAYVCINLGTPLASSSITLYHQSIQKRSGFVSNESFNLSCGAPKGSPAFTNPPLQKFNIGSSMSLERGVPFMGKHVRDGLLVCLNQINSAGGVRNNFLSALIYNDDYTPFLARNNIATFIDKLHTTTILLPVGSPTLDAYLDYLKKDPRAFVFFPVTGSSSFRRQDLPGIIHIRASYADEVHALIDYMMQTYNVRKFAFFYQDDAYGQGPLAVAHELLKARGITDWTDVSYTRSTYSFSQQAKKILESQPDAIGLFSTANAAQSLIVTLGVEQLANKQMFGISFLATTTFRRFVQYKNIDVLFGAVVPNPTTSQVPIVQEYRQAMKKNNMPYYDIFSLEGYIATRLLVEALEKITPPLTPQKIMQQLESIKNYDFKGIELNFNPQSRSLAKHVWIEQGKDKEWIRKDVLK